ncbi:MAG TPA: alpha/beta fold hydrolase [Actinomycetota bacterium]|nr:alpha/beta fold hydrolase [Actinomycetota bacterium]
MKKLACLICLIVTVGAVPATARPEKVPPGQAKKMCSDRLDDVKALTVPVGDETATGRYALPDSPPKALVVFAHGYSHHSESWIEHMRKAAADHGVIAVAMDYRGTYEQANEDGSVTVRGWFVKEGAEDLIAATKLFQGLCPSIEETTLFGVSMGGNASGLALAAAAQEKSPSGDPLFDHWFDVEGAVNVVETYAGASVLAPANEFAAFAKADIEDEMNGTPTDDPEGYADLAVVSHIDEIAASGVQGIAVIHALEDGLVPYNQARELVTELIPTQIPLEVHTIAGKGDGESGTTASGYSPVKDSPFAGHASEKSETHIIMVTAFDRLWSLIDEGVGFESYTEHFVDGL